MLQDLVVSDPTKQPVDPAQPPFAHGPLGTASVRGRVEVKVQVLRESRCGRVSQSLASVRCPNGRILQKLASDVLVSNRIEPSNGPSVSRTGRTQGIRDVPSGIPKLARRRSGGASRFVR